MSLLRSIAGVCTAALAVSFVLSCNDHNSRSGGKTSEPEEVSEQAMALVSAASCNAYPGKNVIVGTEGDDILDGTNKADCIVGLGGNDIIRGDNGDDVIFGGPGQDRIDGNNGKDVIFGGDGDDNIVASNGKDEVHGENGADLIVGSNAPDSLWGEDCHDVVRGGRGPDGVNGGAGHDACNGSACEVPESAVTGCRTSSNCPASSRCIASNGLCVPASATLCEDGAPLPDAGVPPDAGMDAGADAGLDAGIVDAGVESGVDAAGDAALVDAGLDAGFDAAMDAALPDADDDAAGEAGLDAASDGEAGVDAQVDACVPRAVSDVTCDGVDDDCDTVVDDDFPATATTCGTGACVRTGALACHSGTVVDTCTAGEPALSDATCDGIDDDCGGSPDEDYAGVPTSCGVGACSATGSTSCVGGVVVNSCQPSSPASSDSTCNGVDDDCNGTPDDDFVSTASSCGHGPCASTGTRSCVEGNLVDSCEPLPPASPTDEICDGVDEDCDATVDDDYVAQEQFCGFGVCERMVTSRCEGGAEIVTECEPGQPLSPLDDTCDGLDEDCDGSLDEDFPTEITSCGIGVCASTGDRSCVQDASGSHIVDSCVPVSGASIDADCNDVDDDCDGVADDDYEGLPVGCGEGACLQMGVTACENGAEVAQCTPLPAAESDSICNGVDDDCDGSVDEDFASYSSQCGLGICVASGEVQCINGVVVDSCEPISPVLEGVDTSFDFACNGTDEDCDGMVDEDYRPFPTLCGVGACTVEGLVNCVDAAYVTVCVPGTPLSAVDTTCDGIDDDCDGLVDEDYEPLATTCGQGACAATGTTACSNGVVVNACVAATPASTDSLCNLIDDDCDGRVDEDYVGHAVSCGAGSCSQTGTTLCIAGVEQTSCEPGTPAADDTTCDARDDDCDGSVDEDVLAQAITCGVGACGSTGIRRCHAGVFVDECSAGVPGLQDGDCDGLDDDCDGSADEDYRGATITCRSNGCVGVGAMVCVAGAVVPNCEVSPSCSQELDCGDALDNDSDGLNDCADPDCGHRSECFEDCSDGSDNDGDGAVDCADNQCMGRPPCVPEICTNALDDDGDGRSDCLDSECSGAVHCPAIPADPSLEAPPPSVDPEPSLLSLFGFLLEGPNPIQRGATAEFSPVTTALVVFSVRDIHGAPIAGARVEVTNRPDVGYVITQANGEGEMLVPGGGDVTVTFSAPGMLPVYRTVTVGWGRVRKTIDVVMTPPSNRVTALRFDGTAPGQVAMGDVTMDSRGVRRAVLVAPPGLRAQLKFANGNVAPIESGHFRLTEYTAGDLGPYAMPAELPQNTAYTYAFEAELDEAKASGAQGVEFDQPVSIYVDNFLNVPPGLAVPLGYFDPSCRCWVPELDARVMRVVAVQDGIADVDADGDGSADSAAALAAIGFNDEERRRLAELYPAGKSVWRMRMSHLSTWDCNANTAPPADADFPPDFGAPRGETEPECNKGGSIIGCVNQSLSESIPLAGTPYTFDYSSLRARKPYPDSVFVPVTGATVPASLRRVVVQKLVAGSVEQQEFQPLPNQTFEVRWDGIDRFQRLHDQTQRVDISVCNYFLPVRFASRPEAGRTFAAVTTRLLEAAMLLELPVAVPPPGAEFSMCRSYELRMQPNLKANAEGAPSPDRVSAWQISAIPQKMGDAIVQGTDGAKEVTSRVVPAGPVAATNNIVGVLPNGASILARATHSEWDRRYPYDSYKNYRVGLFVVPSSELSSTGNDPYSNPIGMCLRQFAGTPDCDAQTRRILGQISDGAFSREGNAAVLFSETLMALVRFRVETGIRSDGSLRVEFKEGDFILGGPALSVAYPEYDSTGPHADVLADLRHIRFYHPSGTWVMGYISQRQLVVLDDGSAVIHGFPFAEHDGTTLGRSGLWRVRVNGLMEEITSPDAAYPKLTAGPDGTFFATYVRAWNSNIRAYSTTYWIQPDGKALLIYRGDDGNFPPQPRLWSEEDTLPEYDAFRDRFVVQRREYNQASFPTGAAVLQAIDYRAAAAKGGVSFDATRSEPLLYSLFRPRFDTTGTYPFIKQNFFVLPDGKVRFVSSSAFYPSGWTLVELTRDPTELGASESGRITAVVDPRMGRVRRTFEYGPEGAINSIVERNGQRTTLLRNTDGRISEVIGPFGHRTTIAYDAQGRVSTISNPMNEQYVATYDGDTQLLATFRDPEGATSKFTYDQGGRVVRDEDALGGFQTVASTPAPVGGYQTTVHTDADGSSTTYRSSPSTASTHFLGVRHPELIAEVTRTEVPGVRRTTFDTNFSIVEEEMVPDQFGGTSLAFPRKALVRRTNGWTSQYSRTTRPVLASDNNSVIYRFDEFASGYLPDTPGPSDPIIPKWKVFDSNLDNTLEYTAPTGELLTASFDEKRLLRTIRATGMSRMDYEWDEQARLRRVTRGPRVLELNYGVDGLLGSFTAPDGSVTEYERDLAGRVAAVTRAGDTTRIRYDRVGRVVGVTPPGRTERAFERTLKGQVESYRESSTSIESLYTPAGRLREVRFPGGETLRVQRGLPAERFTTETSAPGRPTERSSYARSPQRLNGENDVYSTTYTLSGELVADQAIRTNPSANPAAFRYTHAIGYTYNVDGYPSGYSVDGLRHEAQTRDLAGRITGVGLYRTSGSEVAGYLSIGRNLFSGTIQTRLGPILTETRRNAFLEQDAAIAQFDPTSVSGDEQTFYAVQTLERDGAGRVLQEQEDIAGVVTLRGFGYDGHGRLRDVHINGNHAVHYTYDSNGNRLSRSGDDGEEIGVYDDQDQVQSYGRYDYTTNANGYVEAIRDRAEGTSLRLDYNVRGWLRGATLPDGRVVRYDVDAFGRRIGKSIDGVPVASWMYVDALRPIAEYDAAGSLKWRFSYGEVGHVPSMMAKGSTAYRVISDARGSVRLVIEANTGTVVQRIDYDEFGRVTLDTNPGFQPFGFAGGLYDPETGLVRFGARDYDAYTGRWTARDPILFAGGDSNLYAYAGSDPINRVDHTGLAVHALPIVVGAIAGGVGGLLSALASENVTVVSALQSTAIGAATGAGAVLGAAFFIAELAGVGAGIGTNMLLGGLGGGSAAATANTFAQGIVTGEIDNSQVAVAAVGGAVGGICGGALLNTVAASLPGDIAIALAQTPVDLFTGLFANQNQSKL